MTTMGPKNEQQVVPLGASNWPWMQAALRALNSQVPVSCPERGLLIVQPTPAKKVAKGAPAWEAWGGCSLPGLGDTLLVRHAFHRVSINAERNEVTKANLLLLGGAIKNLAFVEGRTIYGIPWDKNAFEALQMMGMDKNITTLAF